jgi:hypothetical protein
MLIALTGQESAASFSQVIFGTLAFISLALPLTILNPFGQMLAQLPQPMQVS